MVDKKLDFQIGKCRVTFTQHKDDVNKNIILDVSMDDNYCYAVMSQENFLKFMMSMVDFHNELQIKTEDVKTRKSNFDDINLN